MPIGPMDFTETYWKTQNKCMWNRTSFSIKNVYRGNLEVKQFVKIRYDPIHIQVATEEHTDKSVPE